MIRTFILTGFVLALSISTLGQKQKTGADNPSEKKRGSQSSSKNDSKNDGGESILTAGTNLEAQLQSMIDVRKSNVGDEVILKTTKSIKQNGEVIVPKGTNLIGRITEVKRKTKDDATSRVGMIFDRIQGKNLDVPLNASIVSIATAQASTAAGDLFASDISGSSSTSGSASAGRSSSGGGLLGGAGSALGGVANTTTSTVGRVAGTAVNTVGQTTGAVVNTAGSTAGGLGNTVKGLHISQSASGSAQSTSMISAQGKDVRIEKGASFQLRLDSSVKNQE
jgi:hypothetical protein